nr:MAG TPA: Protein of unknown function (DUF1456) [Caudoviricetes sp.]
MSKPKERSLALQLRSEGKTFSQIISILKEQGMSVSKGALHKWFKKKDE